MSVNWQRNKVVGESLLDFIGRTPLVKLRKIPSEEGVKGDILVKIEYMNPTGSLKDRIYYEMITKAIESGQLVEWKSWKHRLETLESPALLLAECSGTKSRS